MGKLLGLATDALLDRFAAPDPTPGGGSAAALSGATGAALAAMVCSMPKTRTNADDERERLATALGWAREAGARLRGLVEEDSEAYDGVVAAYRLPKGTEEEKTTRREAVAKAMTRATEVPMRTAEACLVVMRAAVEALAHGNPNASSDARTAGALAWAGLLGAADNVRVNARSLGEPGADLRERLDAVLADGWSRLRAIGLPP